MLLLLFPGIFNYYHLSLLLTTLNCLADPVLYCFVSENARHGVLSAVRRLSCCRRRQHSHRANANHSNPATDSHEVATDDINGPSTAVLLSHAAVTRTKVPSSESHEQFSTTS